MSGGKSVELLPADVLGNAIERLIGHCQSLDRDRTDLARALSRVQEEFVNLRAEHERLIQAHRELQEHHNALENACAVAVERLERMVSSLGTGIPLTPVQDLMHQSAEVVVQDAGAIQESGAPVQEEVTQQSGLAVAERVIKPLNIGNFERIVRQAGGVLPEPVESVIEAEDSTPDPVVIESSGCIRDRLF